MLAEISDFSRAPGRLLARAGCAVRSFYQANAWNLCPCPMSKEAEIATRRHRQHSKTALRAEERPRCRGASPKLNYRFWDFFDGYCRYGVGGRRDGAFFSGLIFRIPVGGSRSPPQESFEDSQERIEQYRDAQKSRRN